MDILRRLNRTILLITSGAVFGFVSSSVAFVIGIGAGMTRGESSGAETIVLLLFGVTLLASLVAFLSPLWYFFFEKWTKNREYRKICGLVSLLALNVGVIILSVATHEPQYRGDSPVFVETVPMFVILIGVSIFVVRMLFFVLESTEQRFKNAYSSIQFVWVSSLSLNAIYVVSDVANFDNTVFLTPLAFVLTVLIYLLVPLLIIIFLISMYKDISPAEIVRVSREGNGVKMRRKPSQGIDIDSIKNLDEITLKQKLSRSIVLMGIFPGGVIVSWSVFSVENYTLSATFLILAFSVPIWYALRERVRNEVKLVLAFVTFSFMISYLFVRVFDIPSIDRLPSDFVLTYGFLFVAVYAVLILVRLFLMMSERVA